MDTYKSPEFNVNYYVDNHLFNLLTCSECGRGLIVYRYKLRRKSDTSYINRFVKCRNGCLSIKSNAVEDELINMVNYFRHLEIKTIIEQGDSPISDLDKSLMGSFDYIGLDVGHADTDNDDVISLAAKFSIRLWNKH
jgi:hypothetical protein